MVRCLGLLERRSVRDSHLRRQDSARPDELGAVVAHWPRRVAHLPQFRRGSERLARRLWFRQSSRDYISERLEAQPMEETDPRGTILFAIRNGLARDVDFPAARSASCSIRVVRRAPR